MIYATFKIIYVCVIVKTMLTQRPFQICHINKVNFVI